MCYDNYDAINFDETWMIKDHFEEHFEYCLDIFGAPLESLKEYGNVDAIGIIGISPNKEAGLLYVKENINDSKIIDKINQSEDIGKLYINGKEIEPRVIYCLHILDTMPFVPFNFI